MTSPISSSLVTAPLHEKFFLNAWDCVGGTDRSGEAGGEVGQFMNE